MSKLVEKSLDNSEKSPEQELDKLKNQELELKEQIKQPDSFLRNLYSSPAPKKDVIALWATNLERQYDLEKNLGYDTTVKSVGNISTYIKDQLRSMGVHKSTFSYVHEVLGYKYKNDKYDSSKQDENEGDAEHRLNSSNLIADFEKENTSFFLSSEFVFLDWMNFSKWWIRIFECSLGKP